MKGSTMRLALYAAALIIGAIGLNTPLLLISDGTHDIVTPAVAAIPRSDWQARPPRTGATRVAAGDLIGRLQSAGAVTAAGSVRATAHVIPADLPQAPLGRFKLTAYSGPQMGQPEPITATGTAARAGRTVAVDPKVIPLGSKIYIEGLGERIAEDTGGGIKGNHIDVYLGTVPQAVHFGVQRGTVSVVAPPQAKRRASRSRG
ncbi:MAG: 3D domain-containing protein [Candidatus Binatia bacterium]